MLTAFQEDLKTMTLNEALTKHDLTLGEAFDTLHRNQLNEQFRKQIRNVNNRPYPVTERTYIQYHKNTYSIRKYFNKKLRYYGSYATLEDAQKVRDELIKRDWPRDKNELKSIQDMVNVIALREDNRKERRK